MQNKAQITPYDVICGYYDNEMIKSPMSDNPFYEFAYIGNLVPN